MLVEPIRFFIKLITLKIILKDALKNYIDLICIAYSTKMKILYFSIACYELGINKLVIRDNFSCYKNN